MPGKEEELYKNTSVSQHLHSREEVWNRNASSMPQKEQIAISGILTTTLFSVPQKARKITASHKGSDFNRDRVFQGDLVENTWRQTWWSFWKEPWEATALTERRKNDITGVPWAGVTWSGWSVTGGWRARGSSGRTLGVPRREAWPHGSSVVRMSSPLFAIPKAFRSLCCRNMTWKNDSLSSSFITMINITGYAVFI